MYAQYHRDGASKDSIVKVMASFYAYDVLAEAKCLLWSKFQETELLEPLQSRQTSCNRTDKEATCDDIIKAIGSLVENGIKVLCVAHDWNMVPKCHPEGVAELALAEKMATLEGKLKVFEETLGEIKSNTVQNSQKIMQLRDYSTQQGDNNMHATENRPCTRADYPTMAEVVINSRRLLPPKQCATAVMRSVNDNHSEAAIQTARPAPVSVEESTGDGFRTPTEQRRKKIKTAQRETRKNETRNQKRGTIVGKGDSTGLTAVPPPDRDFFIWRVHKSDDIKEVGDYIVRKGVDYRKLEKKSNENARLNSFKLTISIDDMPKVNDPLFWPKGWNVRRWFERSNNEPMHNMGDRAQLEQEHSV